MVLSVSTYIAKNMSYVCSALVQQLWFLEPVRAGITVYKLRNLSDIFVALLGKKQQEKTQDKTEPWIL